MTFVLLSWVAVLPSEWIQSGRVRHVRILETRSEQKAVAFNWHLDYRIPVLLGNRDSALAFPLYSLRPGFGYRIVAFARTISFCIVFLNFTFFLAQCRRSSLVLLLRPLCILTYKLLALANFYRHLSVRVHYMWRDSVIERDFFYCVHTARTRNPVEKQRNRLWRCFLVFPFYCNDISWSKFFSNAAPVLI